jgi:hypothetical protein
LPNSPSKTPVKDDKNCHASPSKGSSFQVEFQFASDSKSKIKFQHETNSISYLCVFYRNPYDLGTKINHFNWIKEDQEPNLRLVNCDSSATSNFPIAQPSVDVLPHNESIVHAIDVGQVLNAIHQSNTSLASDDLIINNDSTNLTIPKKESKPSDHLNQPNQSTDEPIQSNPVASADLVQLTLPGSISRQGNNHKATSFRLPVRCKHFDRLKSPGRPDTSSLSDTDRDSCSDEMSIHVDLNSPDTPGPTPVECSSGSRARTRPHSASRPALCRICLNTSHVSLPVDRLLRPCNCRGPFTFAHHNCLVQWIRSTQSDTCDLCRFRFVLRRRPPRLVRFLSRPSLHRRLLIGFLAALVMFYTNSCARLSVTLLSPYQTISIRLLRLYLSASAQLWSLMFLSLVTVALTWQSLDFVRWRRTHFDLEVSDNPSNLLRDHNMPPRNLIRASGLHSWSNLLAFSFIHHHHHLSIIMINQAHLINRSVDQTINKIHKRLFANLS